MDFLLFGHRLIWNKKFYLSGLESESLESESDELLLYYRAKNSDPGETRTLGPLIKSQLLYQTELRSHKKLTAR